MATLFANNFSVSLTKQVESISSPFGYGLNQVACLGHQKRAAGVTMRQTSRSPARSRDTRPSPPSQGQPLPADSQPAPEHEWALPRPAELLSWPQTRK